FSPRFFRASTVCPSSRKAATGHDISGCAHLFGGAKALLRDVLSRLFHMGFDSRGAVSSSPGLSRAASHFGKGGVTEDE
ncbi:hypothetical protein AB9F44_34675, partial [Rhizobium leguminosarum]